MPRTYRTAQVADLIASIHQCRNPALCTGPHRRPSPMYTCQPCRTLWNLRRAMKRRPRGRYRPAVQLSLPLSL